MVNNYALDFLMTQRLLLGLPLGNESKSGGEKRRKNEQSAEQRRLIVASSTRGHLPQIVMGYDWSVPCAMRARARFMKSLKDTPTMLRTPSSQ